MKKIKILTLLLLFGASSNFINAQPDQLQCKEDIYFTLTGDTPSAQVYPEMVSLGSTTGYDSLVVSPDRLYCQDLGATPYVLEGYVNGMLISSCEGVIHVGEKTPPVVNFPELIDVSVPSSNSGFDFLIRDLTIELSDNCTNPENLIFTPSSVNFNCTDHGETFFFDVTVSDEAGNTSNAVAAIRVSCMVPCDITDGSAIHWPLDFIEVLVSTVDLNSPLEAYAPNELISSFRFPEELVLPELLFCPQDYTVDYDDLLLVADNDDVVIRRTWGVRHNPSSQVFTFEQIVAATRNDQFICDTLPNSADLGDCDSGHTLEDVVEWPDDIFLTNPRITPSELKALGIIDSSDIEPIFKENASAFRVNYEDDIVSVGTDGLVTIERTWLVTHDFYWNYFYQYVQQIFVLTNDFEAMVSVKTMLDRPIPDVVVADGVLTDENGLAILPDPQTVVNPALMDDPLNGLSVIDLVMMRQYILDIESHDEFPYFVEAGDVNANGVLSTIDILQVQRAIIDLSYNSNLEDWRFIDISDELPDELEINKNYVGIKPGDVNDSALLSGDSLTLTSISVSNFEIEGGGNYVVELLPSELDSIFGLEFHLKYDSTLVNIVSIDNQENTLLSNVGGGECKLVFYAQNLIQGEQEENKPIRVIIEALEDGNTLDIFSLLEDKESLIVSSDVEAFRVGEIVPLDDVCTNDIQAPIPYCLSEISLTLDATGEAAVHAINFDQGSFDNCTPNNNLRFTFLDLQPDQNPWYSDASRSEKLLFNESDLGGESIKEFELSMYAWDESNNRDFCQVLLILEKKENCTFDDPNFVIWPSVNLELSLDEELENINEDYSSNVLSPDNLVLLFGYDETEVRPTFNPACDSESIVVSYSDEALINVAESHVKVLRRWTLFDFQTGDVEIFVQTIIVNANVTGGSGIFICDFLPNSAPLGDCEIGHTLEDDVEWPDDLSISDYRIKPDELVVFSNVDAEDTRPIMFNTMSSSNIQYTDIVEDLSQEKLVLRRVWVISATNSTEAWTYDQMITVDLTGFVGLVSVETLNERVVPGVIVNDEFTNEEGIAYVEENEELYLSKSDISWNGLNIRDLALIQDHILDKEVLSEKAELAADIDEDGEVSASDLSALNKVIIGIDNTLSSEWDFYELDEPENIDIKGRFLAIKPGDVDDSARILGTTTYEQSANLSFEDQILIAGVSYDILLSTDFQEDTYGFEGHLSFDHESVEVVGFSEADGSPTIGTHSDMDVHALIHKQLEDNGVLRLTLKAKTNTILSEVIGLSERQSFLLNKQSQLVRIEGIVVENRITSNTNELDLGIEINYYPNPVTETLYIALPEELQGEAFQVVIRDQLGRIILTRENATQIDVISLTQGIFMLELESGEHRFIDKIQVVK